MKHDKKLQWFDLFRGLAAMFVLIGHVRALTFLQYSESEPDALGKVFFFLTGFGHQAVVIFFVLSGYFIIRSIDESFENDRWDLREYIVNRITRLWVVLIPALIVSAVIDSAGIGLLSETAAYKGEIPFMKDVSPIGKIGIATFLGNVFFLQNIFVPTFGSNGALWSLMNEFWYYVLFPLLYFAIRDKYSLFTRLTLGLIAAGLMFLLGLHTALYFLVWLMGGLVYWLTKKAIPTSLPIIVILGSMALFAGVLFLIRVGISPFLFNDYSLGVVTAILLYSFMGKPMKNKVLEGLSHYLSNISYTIYATHLPLAVFISSWALEERLSWSLQSLGVFLTIFSLVFLYSNFMYLLFERNTATVKKLLKSFSRKLAKV
jgi:peptidoglycan/LPS O-acetylase OafA/YrhL